MPPPVPGALPESLPEPLPEPELLPERIAKDYEHIYSKEEMPIVGLLPELKKRGRVQKIVYWFTKFILRITS